MMCVEMSYIYMCMINNTEHDHKTVTLNMYEVTDQTRICMHLCDWIKIHT